METQTIHTENYTVHYKEEGIGNPLIFVHGSITDLRTWRNQITAFAEYFHTITYSRRCHYPESTDEISGGYSVPAHAEDLEELIKILNFSTVNLVGSSYGAFISLLTAINNPEKVKTLVLCEPPVIPLLIPNLNNPLHFLLLLFRDFTAGKSLMNFGKNAISPATKLLQEGDMKEGVRLFANGVLGEGGFEHLPAEIQSTMTDNAEALKAELIGPGFPPFSEKDASKVKIPVQLVYGEKSPAFFHSISDKLHKMLPNSEKTVIPEASHNMHATHPDEFNQIVMNFLMKYN